MPSPPVDYVLNELPQPHELLTFGFLIWKPEPIRPSLYSRIDPLTYRMLFGSTRTRAPFGDFPADELRVEPLPLRHALHLGRDFALAGAMHLGDVDRHR